MPSETNHQRLVSTRQAAAAIGVHQTTLSRWAREGLVIPAQETLGGHLRWDIDDLRRQVAEIIERR